MKVTGIKKEVVEIEVEMHSLWASLCRGCDELTLRQISHLIELKFLRQITNLDIYGLYVKGSWICHDVGREVSVPIRELTDDEMSVLSYIHGIAPRIEQLSVKKVISG